MNETKQTRPQHAGGGSPMIIGACSLCGGPVVAYLDNVPYYGTTPPIPKPPTCAQCGATKKRPWGEEIPMEYKGSDCGAYPSQAEMALLQRAVEETAKLELMGMKMQHRWASPVPPMPDWFTCSTILATQDKTPVDGYTPEEQTEISQRLTRERVARLCVRIIRAEGIPYDLLAATERVLVDEAKREAGTEEGPNIRAEDLPSTVEPVNDEPLL